MTSFIVPAGAGEDSAFDDARLHLAAAAYLARFKGMSREHTDSDLRAFLSWCAGRLPRMHPHMLRHTFVTTMLDVGVDLRDVQIAARHADPRTTMRYDRARKNLDRHPNYILAAYMASGT
jgi:site-specific recombinase XerD